MADDEWRDEPFVRMLRFVHRGGMYHAVKIDSPHHRVEVTVSPTGRSVQVYMDGKRMVPEPDVEVE